jgi:hypothetical protein
MGADIMMIRNTFFALLFTGFSAGFYAHLFDPGGT